MFGTRGRIYAQFEYLRKIHHANIGRQYKEPRVTQEEGAIDEHKPKKARGRPRKVPAGQTLDTGRTAKDTAASAREKVITHNRRAATPLFPPGPEQAKLREKWQSVIDYLLAKFARNRKNRGDIKRMNIVGESLCG